MKKIILFIFTFIICFVFSSVKAEELNVSYVKEDRGTYSFDVLVKDVKDQKINVITGNIKYDKKVLYNFELVEQDNWKMYSKVNDDTVSFVLVNMNGYATENMNVLDIKTSFDGDDKIDFNLESIQSSSNSSIVSITGVTFKYEIPQVEIEPVIPEDLENEVEEENNDGLDKVNKNESKNDNTLMLVVVIFTLIVICIFIVTLLRKKVKGN